MSPQSLPFPRFLLAGLFFLTSLAWAQPPGQPSPAHEIKPAGDPAGQRHDLFGTFYLELDGKPASDALLYHAPSRGGILVRTDQTQQAFRVVPRGQIVQFFDKGRIRENPDGSVTILTGTQPTSVGSFQLEQGVPSFTVDGKTARLVSKPPLIGQKTAAELIEHNVSYRLKADKTRVVEQYVDALKAWDRPVRVRVIFGSWCSVCAEMVPNILALERRLAGSNISFEYVGIAKNNYNDPEAKKYDVTRIPTGIVLDMNGTVLGTVAPSSWRHPATALMTTLAGIAPGS